jgi:hypothetical protein
MDGELQIPLELQRRFERRWSARYSPSNGRLRHAENHSTAKIIHDAAPLVSMAAGFRQPGPEMAASKRT